MTNWQMHPKLKTVFTNVDVYTCQPVLRLPHDILTCPIYQKRLSLLIKQISNNG